MANSFILLNENFNFLMAKIIFLILAFMFIIFLSIVFKQINSMNTIVEDRNDALILKLSSFILLVFAISLFFTALVIL